MKIDFSFIITAKHESTIISHLMMSLLDPAKNNIPAKPHEIFVTCPDRETFESAQREADRFKTTLTWIQDGGVGKPAALNLAFTKAKGDILILTDGDVIVEKGSIPNLLECFKDPSIGGISGRPVSNDSKNSFWGYIGHLLADSAHDKRINTTGFFPMSGYLMAIRKPNFEIPKNTLAEDAYISYMFAQSGQQIAYAKDAHVLVSYPKNLSDWLSQKSRSLGGYMQNDFGSRTFFSELTYFFFPLQYAQNPREFIWSLALYPLRLFLWMKIVWEQKITRKSFEKTWVRVESTKIN